MILLCFYIKGVSQCTFKDCEKYISDSCFNCNESEVNDLIYKKCLVVDSIVIEDKIRFYKKLNKNSGTANEKYNIKKRYDSIYNELINTRKKIYSNYNYLTKGGYNNYYTSLFYWYYTDKINAMLVDIETSILGDK